jgi:hypothetical protein
MLSRTTRKGTPLWPRALGAFALAVLAGSLLYAAAIALVNLSRIGV